MAAKRTELPVEEPRALELAALAPFEPVFFEPVVAIDFAFLIVRVVSVVER